MAISKNWGYTASETSHAITVPTLVHSQFALKDNKDMESRYSNITSPVDQPEEVRIATKKVTNVYSGSGITPSFMSSSKEGISSLIQIRDILRVHDDGVSDAAGCCFPWTIDLPAKVNVTVQIPRNQYFGATEAIAVLHRTIAVLEQAASDEATLNKILRGSTSVLG